MINLIWSHTMIYYLCIHLKSWRFQKLKNSYDRTKKFQFERVAKLLCAKGVFVTNGVFHIMRCKVCTTINRKPCLIAPKWNTLMKHTNFFLAIYDYNFSYKRQNLVITNTCDYKPCSCLGQVAKANKSQKTPCGMYSHTNNHISLAIAKDFSSTD
jgi:hypothetical protein